MIKKPPVVLPDNDAAVVLWRANKLVELHRLLNSYDMEGILNTLEGLSEKGFSPKVDEQETNLKNARIDIRRMRVAMNAVWHAGEMSAATFEKAYQSELNYLFKDQRDDIIHYLLIYQKTINIWATSGNVAGTVCEDASLHDENGRKVLGPSTPHGQAGWNLGINFADIRDLADKMSSQQDDAVGRLAINAHGLPGKLYFNGGDFDSLSLSFDNLKGHPWLSHLEKIKKTLSPNATLIFASCLAGSGEEGSKLLIELSKFFPGRLLVGFTTVGFIGASSQSRPGDACTEPGARDGYFQTPSSTPKQEWSRYFGEDGKIWNDLKALPWQSEYSPHAKAAQNGTILWQPTSLPQDRVKLFEGD